MITFTLAYYGAEEDLPHLANLLMEPLEMSSRQALALVAEVIDVDRRVELTVTDGTFGRLMAEIFASVYVGHFDADEIVVSVMEPAVEDPAVHRIHIRDRVESPWANARLVVY